MKVLQSTQGLGVRPARYSLVKLPMILPPNSSRMSRMMCVKPRLTAMLRASAMLSRSQHPVIRLPPLASA